MKTAFTTFVLFIVFTLVSQAHAQESDSGDGAEFFASCAVLGQEEFWAVRQGYLQKGERISARFCDRKGLSPTRGHNTRTGAVSRALCGACKGTSSGLD